MIAYLTEAGDKVATNKKLAMLLALSNASRSSDLRALDLRYRSYSEEGVLFRIPETRRSSAPREAFFKAFKQNPHLCPMTTLKQYERDTQDKRDELASLQPLFISMKKPFKGVSSSTIARWLKDILREAGIDTEIFKSHSTRAAASSSAKLAGMSTEDILKMAGWSRDSTFERLITDP